MTLNRVFEYGISSNRTAQYQIVPPEAVHSLAHFCKTVFIFGDNEQVHVYVKIFRYEFCITWSQQYF